MKLKNKFLKDSLDEIKRVAAFWREVKAGTFGSSVAYYAIFSIAPILLILLSVISLFLDRSYATTELLAEITNVFGKNGADFMNSLINSRVSDSTSIIASIGGFIILLLGAAGVFNELQKALDIIFDSLPKKVKSGVWQTVRKKLLSFGMVLSLGFILLVSLVLSVAISLFVETVGGLMPAAGILIRIADFILSLSLISLFLSVLYKFLPSYQLEWRPALQGGALSGILFTISKYVLGWYLGSSSSFDAYGTASTLVFLIVWVFYMAQVFFFSAIIVRLYLVKKPL